MLLQFVSKRHVGYCPTIARPLFSSTPLDAFYLFKSAQHLIDYCHSTVGLLTYLHVQFLRLQRSAKPFLTLVPGDRSGLQTRVLIQLLPIGELL